MPKFSIITPVRLGNGSSDRPDRVERFKDCIESVKNLKFKNQSFKDFEWIVLDDGSPEEFDWSLVFQAADNVNLLRLPHNERIIALNTGLRVARGDWICFLDSDDELDFHYLEKIDEQIKKHPGYKMFNFGAKFIHPDGATSNRDPFEPKKKKIGHEVFGGGNIVNGTFVFHKSVYADLGGYPGDETGWIKNIDCSELNYGRTRDLYMGSPYDFSAAMQLKFPELRQFFMVDHINEPNKIIKEVGNPWGNDFAIWYTYTRKYHSFPFKEYLYIVNLKK